MITASRSFTSSMTTYLLKPSELWGVSMGPKCRKRGAAARDRRTDKRRAKRAGMPLKAYLRTLAPACKAGQ